MPRRNRNAYWLGASPNLEQDRAAAVPGVEVPTDQFLGDVGASLASGVTLHAKVTPLNFADPLPLCECTKDLAEVYLT
jgi:hypothetical protein